MVKRHEGLRLKVYNDHLGNATIGYGHQMIKTEYKEISMEKAEEMLSYDLLTATEAFWHIFPYPRWFSENRKNAMIDMIFQLGPTGFRHFKKAIAHVEMAQWPEAAADFRDSLWARQTPVRAEEICRMIELG
jgi:lysozyme